MTAFVIKPKISHALLRAFVTSWWILFRLVRVGIIRLYIWRDPQGR
jgi:hypothetical protein